jgi:PIN domain nuclease of toxin-antitoxin system
MLYLDTHVVVWLFEKDEERLSGNPKRLIEENDLLVSPMVLLELQYLHEIGKITVAPKEIEENLAERLGLKVCPRPFAEVVRAALSISWTRDPFDRIITAQAAVSSTPLLTRDEGIRDHYRHAVWR